MTSRTGRVARRPGRHIAAVVGIALVVVILSACAASPNEAAAQANEAGFLLGVWHGMIAPIAFLVSLFNDSIGVYEVDNTGGWYDFGFLLGVSIVFSGGGAGGSRSARRR